jgi:hypothetical protein
MLKPNHEIRERAKSKGVHLWEIAEAFGVHEKTFTCWLRHEFDPKRKAQALKFIDEIAAGRCADDC